MLQTSSPRKKTSLAEREAGRQAQAVPPGWGSANTWGRPLKQAQGLFVRKQEQGLILAGRALPEEVGGLPVSRPHFPYAGVFVGIMCLLIKGSVYAFGGGTLAPNIILSRGLPHSAATSRIN